MLKKLLAVGLCIISSASMATSYALMLPITPFSNMESGYQATNPGFRVLLKTNSGFFLGGGPLTMDAVIKGKSDDASRGSAYGKLILNVSLPTASPWLKTLNGDFDGVLTICMATDAKSRIEDTQCKDLSKFVEKDRPFQWIDKAVKFNVSNGVAKVTSFSGNTGEGGTSEQLSLSIFHPAYGFAAPGKAFKDYQSPLVLDLNHDGRLNLTNVWDDKNPIFFDLNGHGKKVRTGWVEKEDGLLFIDSGKGCALNGTQFFGEYTNSQNGKKTFQNGFEALSKLYDPKGTGKVVLADHPEIKVWRNRAQDGVCKSSEVYPASQFVKEISVAYEKVKNVKLTADNEIRLVGSYLGADNKTHLVGDVWFKQRRNPNAYVAQR